MYHNTDEVPLTLWVRFVSTKWGLESDPPCPFPWIQFDPRMGQDLGQLKTLKFDGPKKCHKAKETSQDPQILAGFWLRGGGFEPPTSGL